MGVLGDAGSVILKDHVPTPPLHHTWLRKQNNLNIIVALWKSGRLELFKCRLHH